MRDGTGLKNTGLFGEGFIGINQKMRRAKPMKSLPNEKQVYGKKWDDLHF